MRKEDSVENSKSRINLSRNSLGKNVLLNSAPPNSIKTWQETAETNLGNGSLLASGETCLHELKSSPETVIECSYTVATGENAHSINEHIAASFHLKPYAKAKAPSQLAQNRNAVKKKKTETPVKTMDINLDMPGFQRLNSVLAIFPVSRAAWYAGIAEGRYPAGIQIGKRSVAWSNASIKALIEDVSNQEGDTFDTS